MELWEFIRVILVTGFVAWCLALGYFYFVADEAKRNLIREKYGDPSDCPGVIWGWVKYFWNGMWLMVNRMAGGADEPDPVLTVKEDGGLANAAPTPLKPADMDPQTLSFATLRVLTNASKMIPG